ncbi:unnamed protein product [Closterium sp. NIES-65]|nr:unnamed protein product [Closterium sp. NIES-65]
MLHSPVFPLAYPSPASLPPACLFLAPLSPSLSPFPPPTHLPMPLFPPPLPLPLSPSLLFLPLSSFSLSPLSPSLLFLPLSSFSLSPLSPSLLFLPLSSFSLSPLSPSLLFLPLSSFSLSPLSPTSFRFLPLSSFSHLFPLSPSLLFLPPLSAFHLSPLSPTSFRFPPLSSFSHLFPLSTSLLSHPQLMNANGIVALPVAAPPGKWLGAGGANIVDGEKQYIGVVSMADVAMHVVREAARPAALKAGVVSLIGNSPEGLSLWVASTSTPLVDAMEPLSKGIHRLLVRCPIAPPAAPSPAYAAPTAMTFGHATPEAPETQGSPAAEGGAEAADATGGEAAAAEGEAGTTEEASDAARPATGAESEAAAPPLALKHSYHFVSQTDVAAFLLLHVDALGDVAQRTVEQLGLADPLFPPLAIVSGITVTAALRLMQRAGGVRAVAVVAGSAEEEERMEEGEGSGAASAAGADVAGGRGGGGGGAGRGRERGEAGWVRGGRLLGTLSVSDLRGMDAETLAQLTSMKVRDFLAHMASLSPEGRRPSITCRMAAPLAEVMALAATNRVHRVWVTGEDDELLGVVSLTDVISACRRAGGHW